MTNPVVAQQSPYGVDVEEGKRYYWCACGRSANQPFCDGSHEGTEFMPIKYKAEASGRIFFCGCKHSQSKPLCDGTHNTL